MIILSNKKINIVMGNKNLSFGAYCFWSENYNAEEIAAIFLEKYCIIDSRNTDLVTPLLSKLGLDLKPINDVVKDSQTWLEIAKENIEEFASNLFKKIDHLAWVMGYEYKLYPTHKDSKDAKTFKSFTCEFSIENEKHSFDIKMQTSQVSVMIDNIWPFIWQKFGSGFTVPSVYGGYNSTYYVSRPAIIEKFNKDLFHYQLFINTINMMSYADKIDDSYQKYMKPLSYKGIEAEE